MSNCEVTTCGGKQAVISLSCRFLSGRVSLETCPANVEAQMVVVEEVQELSFYVREELGKNNSPFGGKMEGVLPFALDW